MRGDFWNWSRVAAYERVKYVIKLTLLKSSTAFLVSTQPLFV